MISHEEALDLVLANSNPLPAEDLPPSECSGRVLARGVAARLASPPFDKSAMDGFAVRASDVGRLPVELRLVGESFAGQWPLFEVGPGQCARITTGAPVPCGTDTVVMVEDTSMPGENIVRVTRLTGRNICPKGEDVQQGQVVLQAGETLTPLRLGIAAGAGCDRLRVYRRPSVAVLCTGTEVKEPPAPVAPGQIYNSNGPILRALLEPLSSAFEYLGIAPDRPDDLQAAVERGLASDILVVAGGVSVGPLDLVPAALGRSGVQTVFHNCAIKPGKPIFFGKRASSIVFGLPGNPFSCFVAFHILMCASFAKMTGAAQLPPVYKRGLMRHGFANRPGRKTFRPCRVDASDGVNRIELVASKGSADIMGASAADALLVVPREAENVEAGEAMDFIEV